MKRLRVIFACTAASIVLSACSQSATGPPSLTSVNPGSPGYSKLQIVVGTANIAGAATGLNVVSTLRQPNGDSAVLVDQPTLTGPFTLPGAAAAGNGVDAYSTLQGGPSAQEVAIGATIGGTPQSVHPGTPVCDSSSPCPGPVAPNTTTFGQSGGVFGMGFAPYNHTNGGVAASYVPYPEPMFDTTGNAFIPWGGPPSFDPNKDGMGTRDGTFNLGVQLGGVGEGITVFENVTPSAGSYTLSVVIPTGPTSTATVSTSATLASIATLPTAGQPVVALDGNGGGTFTVALPAGVTEGYVQVIDFGPGGTPTTPSQPNCGGPLGTQAFPVYYTIHVTASGAATLPDLDGPNTNIGGGVLNRKPSESICSAAANTLFLGTATAGDNFLAYFVGFDYPIFAASYPQSLGVQAPVLPGSNGQADITISAPTPLLTALDHGRMRIVHGKVHSLIHRRHH